MKPLWAIACVAQNRTIGSGGELPWHYPEDMKRFRKITTGHPIIMGRKTYESIGKPLPKRENIIITRNPHLMIEGCYVTNSLVEAYEIAEGVGSDIPIIVGGAAIYNQAMPSITRLFLTVLKKEYPGDTFFPVWDRENWTQTEREEFDEFTFMTFERRNEQHID